VSIPWACFFSSLLDGAAEANAELASNPVSARIVQRQIIDALKQRASSESGIDQFLMVTCDNGKAIRDAINSGTRTFRDLVPLLGHARQFKTWLKGKPFDASLVREYVADVTKAHWTQRMASKVVRWAVFTGGGLALDLHGAGGLGTAAGVAASTADAFLVDRLFSGWRPNQFVSGPLADFLKASGEPGKRH
jgi:hypothetical protein